MQCTAKQSPLCFGTRTWREVFVLMLALVVKELCLGFGVNLMQKLGFMPAEERIEMHSWKEMRVVFDDYSCDPSAVRHIAANPRPRGE